MAKFETLNLIAFFQDVEITINIRITQVKKNTSDEVHSTVYSMKNKRTEIAENKIPQQLCKRRRGS